LELLSTCRCRRSQDADVEVADDVAMIEVVMIIIVLVLIGVAAFAGSAKNCAFFLDGDVVMEEAPSGCQRVHSGGVLQTWL
jgi:hypothetical protein